MMRLVIILAILCATNCRGHQEKTSSCSSSCGNIQDIHYPFRLTGDPNSCGLSAYQLACQNNRTILTLNSNKYFVLSITYTNFSIRILDPALQNKTHTSSPFPLHHLNPQNLPRTYHLFRRRFNSPAAFLSCRNPANSSLYVKSQSEDSSFSYVLVGEHVDVGKIEDSCRITGAAWFSTSQLSPGKMSLGQIHDALAYGFEVSWLPLKCSAVCGKKYCRIEDDNRIACVYASRLASNSNSMPLLHKCEIFGPIFLVVLVILATFGIYFLDKKKKEQMKIERFLDDYKALKPARYLYADIKKITNKFSEKLGEGAYGTVYKGRLSHDVFVAVKVLNNSKGDGDGEEFINEVSAIGSTHHVNVVRLVGYCADGFHRALVYEYLVNDSLEKFISSPNDKNFLGWEKLQQIALGIAKGIEYLHQGCDQRILHFDIKPNNILLDENLNPKISDFGQAKLCSKEKSIVSMTNARGTMGYIAPEVFSRNFGNVSYKSDIYSFGMLLLEMVGGRNKSDGDVGSSEIPEWIYKMMNKGEEEIEIEIEKEKEGDDCKIARKLAIVGLWCIQWYPVDRPSIKVVIQMIEAEEAPSMPPNPFGSTHTSYARASKPGKMFTSGLEIITESE